MVVGVDRGEGLVGSRSGLGFRVSRQGSVSSFRMRVGVWLRNDGRGQVSGSRSGLGFELGGRGWILGWVLVVGVEVGFRDRGWVPGSDLD